MQRAIAMFWMLMLVGSTAQAAEALAGGPLYAGTAQSIAVCYLFNAGTTDLTINGFALATPSGTPANLTTKQCGTTLAARHICGIAATVSNSVPYVCRFVVSPDKANARGTLEMRAENEVTLQNTELQ